MEEILEKLYTYKEAMEHFQISRATMYRLLQSGQLVGKKLGGEWRFTKEQMDAALRPAPMIVESEQGEETTS